MKIYRSDHFDTQSNSVLNKAIATANSLECGEVNCSHLLASIITINNKMGNLFYSDTKHTKDEYIEALKRQCKAGEFGVKEFEEITVENFSEPMKKLFDKVLIEAAKRRDIVHIDDLYLACFSIDESEVFETLQKMGISKSDIRVKKDDDPLMKMPTTAKYACDMCVMARENMFDPIEARDDIIDTVIEILGRRQKGNPCLVGEPGVGKTAIIEGLAQRIINDDVPSYMKGKHIISVSVSDVVSGSKFRGEFEERINNILYEADENKNVILFFDEFHMLMEAGTSNVESAMNAANILKPAISRGNIKIIGATTFKEYMKYVETDSAFNRRIQKVIVDEPSIEVAIKMTKKVAPIYEKYHNCNIGDEAIVAAVRLSDRYITDKKLPDKAINVIDETAARLKKIAPENVKFDLDIKDIRETISNITKIDVSDIDGNSKTRLQDLDNSLRKKVIGQDDAISSAVKSIRRSKAGINDPNKPIASFLFVGPTGVGKTELTKALATEFTGNIKNLIKFDMSEFMEKHTVSRLIGAPPGYIGFGDGGQLTEAVRNNPNTVVLFDEIEKAHPDVFNIMLQILDEGNLTDSKGVKVDFKNTIIVMTSNAGYGKEESKSIGFNSIEKIETSDETENKAKEALEKTFRPEFINRLDKIVVFRALTKEDCFKIAELELNKLGKRLTEKKISVEFDESIKNHIVEVGYSEKYGARNIKRKVQELVEDTVADYLIDEMINSGDSIKVSYNNKVSIYINSDEIQHLDFSKKLSSI